MRPSLIILAFGAMAFAAPIDIPNVLTGLLGGGEAKAPAPAPAPKGQPGPPPPPPLPDSAAGDDFQFESNPPAPPLLDGQPEPKSSEPKKAPKDKPKPDMVGMLLGQVNGVLGKLKIGPMSMLTQPVGPPKAGGKALKFI